MSDALEDYLNTSSTDTGTDTSTDIPDYTNDLYGGDTTGGGTTDVNSWASSWGGLNADGTINWDKFAKDDPYGLGVSSADVSGVKDAGFWDNLGSAASAMGSKAFNALKKAYTTKDGSIDWRSVAGTAGGLYGLYQANKNSNAGKVGYQGTIPTYESTRARVENTYDPTRRPGSSGQRYFSDTIYSAPGEAATAAQTTAKEQATGLAALNAANPAIQRVIPAAPTYTGQQIQNAVNTSLQQGFNNDQVKQGAMTNFGMDVSKYLPTPTAPASSVINTMPVPVYKAAGGILGMAQGKYLNGATDGMADKIPARIDGKQEARLSHGEFVVPADVVSHLGNGNSEAGAQRLYSMMDKIRNARTGTSKQGKQINPDKFLPA